MKRLKVNGAAAAVTELPDDIIFEILTRVSCATSLWEFRCVCKSWCSMISSPNFIQSHLNHSLLTSNFVILSNTFHNPTTKILPLRTFLALDDASFDDESQQPDKYAIEVDCSVFMNYDNPKLPIRVISTCNGLCLMLVNQRDFYLWNPFTKLVRKLPDFLDRTDLLHHPDVDPIIIRCGAFGFDDRFHDYNIVAFETNSNGRNTTKFYSLKTDSWTRLKDFKCTHLHRKGQFLNGEVHWLTVWYDSDGLRITSLDLSSQVKRALDLPNNLSFSETKFRGFGDIPHISVHGGCLYVICEFKFSLDIWLLKDNGVPDSSWVKVATMQRFDARNGYCPQIQQTKILCITEDGGFLLSRVSQDIVIYKPKSDSYTFPFLRSLFRHADICIQSLVSPFPDGMVKKKSQTRYHESPKRSCNRAKSQMAHATRRSPLPSLSHSTVYSRPFLSLSSLRRSRRSRRSRRPARQPSSSSYLPSWQSMAESHNRKCTNSQMGPPTRRSPPLSSLLSWSSSRRRSTRFHHLPPSPSMEEQDCPGSRF